MYLGDEKETSALSVYPRLSVYPSLPPPFLYREFNAVRPLCLQPDNAIEYDSRPGVVRKYSIQPTTRTKGGYNTAP